MPPIKRLRDTQKKPVKKIKILQIKRSEQKSLLSEYFYIFLGVLWAVIALIGTGFGLRLDEAIVVGLWVVAIIFFIRQAVRYFKGEPAPQKQLKKEGAAPVEKPYKPPALPRVSKDFSPMPPAGDKRYPPPSPFIKPPK
ncbi:MAG: hypothetical protein ABSH39_03665 [Candidatus Acidiferrum sp.]|jgi:hypothetical protein